MFFHASHVHDQYSNTFDMISTPEICRFASGTQKNSKVNQFKKILMVTLKLIKRNNQISMTAKLLAQQLNALMAESNITLLKR